MVIPLVSQRSELLSFLGVSLHHVEDGIAVEGLADAVSVEFLENGGVLNFFKGSEFAESLVQPEADAHRVVAEYPHAECRLHWGAIDEFGHCEYNVLIT